MHHEGRSTEVLNYCQVMHLLYYHNYNYDGILTVLMMCCCFLIVPLSTLNYLLLIKEL